MTRSTRLGDAVRRSFWALPGAAVGLGLMLGLLLPTLDDELDVRLQVPFFSFEDAGAIRGLLETIATVTVSVAGIAFSVTVVALQLASQQLGPRVLRTFQDDRLSQVTLAAFIGTFVYCLMVLAAFGSGEDSLPRMSAAIAVFAAIGAFLLFVAFIHNIVVSLQASTLIRRIATDARSALDGRFPAGIGREPDDAQAAATVLEARPAGAETREVTAPRGGYLVSIDGAAVIGEARAAGGCVVQRAAIGDFIVTGDVLAEIWAAEGLDDLERCVLSAFEQGEERTVPQDVAFPIRQLADVALRALSPSLNDPTTAENAMGSLSDTLIVLTREPAPAPVRADEDGQPRLVTLAPSLDDLVRLGFDQVRLASAGHPALELRLVALLDRIESAAEANGVACSEAAHQRRLIVKGSEAGVANRGDADRAAS